MEPLQLVFQRVWTNVFADVIAFIPVLIVALIVLALGLIVAGIIGWIVEKVIKFIKLDSALQGAGIEPYLSRANLRLDSGRLLGRIVYWFLVVLTILGVSDILQLWQISEFLRQLVVYLPHLVAAVLIMMAAILFANFLKSVVRASVLAAKLHASRFLGSLTWWAVIVVGVIASLNELGIATTIVNFVNYLAIGLIAMVAIAGGIAFGLGGRDYAAHVLARLREETENR